MREPQRTPMRWYEGPPFFIEPPLPWAPIAAVITAFAVGFLGGMWAITQILP